MDRFLLLYSHLRPGIKSVPGIDEWLPFHKIDDFLQAPTQLFTALTLSALIPGTTPAGTHTILHNVSPSMLDPSSRRELHLSVTQPSKLSVTLAPLPPPQLSLTHLSRLKPVSDMTGPPPEGDMLKCNLATSVCLSPLMFLELGFLPPCPRPHVYLLYMDRLWKKDDYVV